MTSKSSLSKPITNIILAATIIATLKQCQINDISIQIQSSTIQYYAPSTVKVIILAMKIIIHIIHDPILKDYDHHEDDDNVQAVPCRWPRAAKGWSASQKRWEFQLNLYFYLRLTCICAFVTLFREQKLKFNTKVHRSVPQFIRTLRFREKKTNLWL